MSLQNAYIDTPPPPAIPSPVPQNVTVVGDRVNKEVNKVK